jgi:hypothetical protein
MKITSLFLMLLVSYQLLNAQDRVKSLDKTMSLGSKPSHYVEIDGYDQKNTEKAWEEFIKPYGKVKENKKAKEFFLNKVSIPAINGVTPLDIYAKIEGTKTQSTAYIWVDLGGGFANSKDNLSQVNGIKTFMNDFYIFAKKRAIAEELKAEENKQKDLEKDLSKLESKNSNLLKDIETFKERIKKAENEIVQNLGEQDNKKVEIKRQQKVVESTVEKLNNVGKAQ